MQPYIVYSHHVILMRKEKGGGGGGGGGLEDGQKAKKMDEK